MEARLITDHRPLFIHTKSTIKPPTFSRFAVVPATPLFLCRFEMLYDNFSDIFSQFFPASFRYQFRVCLFIQSYCMALLQSRSRAALILFHSCSSHRITIIAVSYTHLRAHETV